MENPITIVTAFFDINREEKGDGRKLDEYLVWIKETMQLNCNMFIVTEEKFKDFFIQHRNPTYATYIMIMTFNNLYFYKYYDQMKTIIESNEYKNKITSPNRVECLLPEYNIIQYSKFHFLYLASELNPFQSTHFFWLDAGASRFFKDVNIHSPFPSDLGIEIIKQNDNKFIAQCREDILTYNINNNFIWKADNLIYGGMFGGNKSVILFMLEQVEEIFVNVMLKNSNINNEQLALAIIHNNFKDAFALVTNNNKPILLLNILSQQTKPFSKVIVWGFPLHTHTHSYIHYGWVKAFTALGYETHWFSDNNFPVDFDYNNCLFITEGYADNNIPIMETSTYFVHIARNPEVYIGNVKRFVEIRYLVDSIKDCNYNYVLDKSKCTKISDCTYYEKLSNNGGIAKHHDNPIPMEYECIYTCWATDLLPEEIKEEYISYPKENKIYWFGSANHENTREIALFFNECVKHNIDIIVNDPWTNPLPFEVVQEQTMKSIMSPDFRSSGDPYKIALGETGTCHKQNGYIACRLFKSISYGHLGITNSKHAYELLEQKVIYNDNEAQLFYDAIPHLNNHDLIKEQMKIVREKHTYLNRIQDLFKVLEM